MKKIFFALAAVIALASCSKSEVEYEQTGEITFTPVTKNITKSMITGTAFPTTESFNVWAWYNQVPAGTTPAGWNKETDNLYVTEG
jgi:opacity protein-like surface antigen